MIRVVLVDDQDLVRAGVNRILENADDIEVVAECRDGDQVVDAVRNSAPDVVLMDIRMKRVDGAAATRLVRELADPPPVLVLTTFDDAETVAAALSAGAAGFVLKDARGEDLIAATRTVAAGRHWLDPGITGQVLDTLRTTALPRAEAAARVDELTDREAEVLAHIGRGLSNTEIAQALFISEPTVKSHVGSILSKLALRDRAAAIVFAFDHGLVRPGGT